MTDLQPAYGPCDGAPVAGGQANTILVVEDNPSTGEILCEILRDEAIPSVWARSGRAALEYLAGALPPCMVLLDLFMPGVSGFDLLEHLHADANLRDVPVLIVSAADRRALDRARQLHPGVEVVAKPLDLDQLLQRIRTCGAS